MAGSVNNDQDKIQVSVKLNLSKETIEKLDKLKTEYGARTRARAIEMLFQDLFDEDEADA